MNDDDELFRALWAAFVARKLTDLEWQARCAEHPGLRAWAKRRRLNEMKSERRSGSFKSQHRPGRR